MGLFSFAGDLIGGVLGARSASRDREQTDFWNRQSQAWSREQFRELQDRSIQNRVIDAKKAGIHPLYALGMSPGPSVPFIAGQSASGNALGEGISRAGRSLEAAVRTRRTTPLVKAQIRREEAAAARDEAAAAQIRSAMKRAEQEANYRRPGVGSVKPHQVAGVSSDEVRIYPEGAMPGTVAKWMPSGRPFRVTNPELENEFGAMISNLWADLREGAGKLWHMLRRGREYGTRGGYMRRPR